MSSFSCKVASICGHNHMLIFDRKTGWLDFKLEADGDIVSRLEKHRNDDAINQQRDWSNHMRAFLSKLIDHVIKRGKVTFGKNLIFSENALMVLTKLQVP